MKMKIATKKLFFATHAVTWPSRGEDTYISIFCISAIKMDRAVDHSRQAPVNGVMLSMDSQGRPHYQAYEYRSEHFTVDPQYSSPEKPEAPAAQRSIPESFFESSFTKNWFSFPRDLDAYCSQSSSSSTPESRLFEAEVMLVYQRAVSSIEKYQTALSRYVASLESGTVDTLALDSERAGLLLLYQDAYNTVNEYQGMYNVDPMQSRREIGPSSAFFKPKHSVLAQTPRTRARRIYHM
jgi:hypothetical protein